MQRLFFPPPRIKIIVKSRLMMYPEDYEVSRVTIPFFALHPLRSCLSSDILFSSLCFGSNNILLSSLFNILFSRMDHQERSLRTVLSERSWWSILRSPIRSILQMWWSILRSPICSRLSALQHEFLNLFQWLVQELLHRQLL